MQPDPLFDLTGRTAAVTGGGGVLCGCLARALGQRGVNVAVLDRSEEAAEQVAGDIRAAGGAARGFACDVLQPDSLRAAAAAMEATLGPADLLINGAGGNRKEATTSDELSFFDLPPDALRAVVDLNLLGSVLPSQVFGRRMAERGGGSIINISSMNSFRPLTRIVGYSAAKAAVNNFTQWLAVHIARNHAREVRVNAIAPGFFETAQNRFLLRGEDGTLTDRGRQIIEHTPMGRFGEPEDLVGAVVWLASPAARFVSGVVVPVDGGFSAYSGV